jgi:hypothetical protein
VVSVPGRFENLPRLHNKPIAAVLAELHMPKLGEGKRYFHGSELRIAAYEPGVAAAAMALLNVPVERRRYTEEKLVQGDRPRKPRNLSLVPTSEAELEHIRGKQARAIYPVTASEFAQRAYSGITLGLTRKQRQLKESGRTREAAEKISRLVKDAATTIIPNGEFEPGEARKLFENSIIEAYNRAQRQRGKGPLKFIKPQRR